MSKLKITIQNPKLFLIVALWIVLGLSFYGYLKATPGRKGFSEKGPQIEIAPRFFDFGEVEYGKVVEHSFIVKNKGGGVLEIKKVATSCACTKAEIAKKKIDPGEEVELKVIYNTGAMSGFHSKGKQERTVYLKSNDPLRPQAEVKIKAIVI